MADVRASGLATKEAQKLALLNAAEAAVADAREKALVRRRSRTGKAARTVALSLGLLGFGFGIYLLVARPPWFFTPPPPPETAVIQEASLRLMLVRESDRLKRYRAQHGKLPLTLEQAGSPVHGVLYEPSNDSTFRLIATFGAETIGLSSTDSVAAFLGSSLKVIASRGRP